MVWKCFILIGFFLLSDFALLCLIRSFNYGLQNPYNVLGVRYESRFGGLCEVEAKAFENVKNQIGYCGLWCGSCVVGNGTLKELTKRYEEIIKGYGVDKWGAKDFDSKEFMKGLASIQTLPTCQGCLKGDGNDECKIRPCASSRKISDCNECNEVTTCNNLEALQKVRKGALRVGMLIKTDKGQQQPIEKLTAELKNKWPSKILFLKYK